jgi:heterogeneous nuclear ribonucleoprotein K
MIVNENHAGAIIGRGGSKIKELQDQTKSSITVYKTCCPGSTDRVVQITTGQSNMPEVVQAIIDFIREVRQNGLKVQPKQFISINTAK